MTTRFIIILVLVTNILTACQQQNNNIDTEINKKIEHNKDVVKPDESMAIPKSIIPPAELGSVLCKKKVKDHKKNKYKYKKCLKQYHKDRGAMKYFNKHYYLPHQERLRNLKP